MPLPALLLAAAPYLASAAAGAAGGFLGKRFGGRSNTMPQQMGGNQNMMSQKYPGGTLGVQAPRFNQQQQGMFDQLGQQGMMGMQNLPKADFADIEKDMTSQFHQNIVPGLAEQFTAGGAGSQRSSAFQQAMGGAGAGLQERLASMKQGFNMQNRGQEINRLMSMLQMGGQQQFENTFIPPKQSMWGQATGSLLTGAGAAGMAYLPQLLQYLSQGSGTPTQTSDVSLTQ